MRIFPNALFCFCFCCRRGEEGKNLSIAFLPRIFVIFGVYNSEMWYLVVEWFVSVTTYPIVIEGRRIMFLALAKAQRALILVEDVGRKFSAFSNAAIIVAQHFSAVFFFLTLVTQWLIKYNEVFEKFMFFTSPPEKSRIAVSQIYSLPRHSVIAWSFLTRAGGPGRKLV